MKPEITGKQLAEMWSNEKTRAQTEQIADELPEDSWIWTSYWDVVSAHRALQKAQKEVEETSGLPPEARRRIFAEGRLEEERERYGFALSELERSRLFGEDE